MSRLPRRSLATNGSLALAAAALAVISACGADDAAPGDDDDPTTDALYTPTGPECDPGDEAWVRRAHVAILGQRPSGVRELAVLRDLAAAAGRETVARAMAEHPRFGARWTDWIIGQLGVDRAHWNLQRCYDEPTRPAGDPALARRVRDLGPSVPAALAGAPWTMVDLIDSAIALDDLSVAWQANLFPMLRQVEFYSAADGRDGNDLARRRAIGERFTRTYTHRGLSCLGCHSATFSVTDAVDPAEDRFWTAGEDFATPVFGEPSATRSLELYTAFRHDGVIARTNIDDELELRDIPEDPPDSQVRPWGMDGSCAELLGPEHVRDDVAGFQGHLVSDLGPRASVWDVEAALRRGLDANRSADDVAAAWYAGSGDRALAWLLAGRVADRMWRTVVGWPLTVGHFFPRNAAQSGHHGALTEHILRTGFSLESLLVRIVTDPLFSLPDASADCESSTYGLPRIYDPFTTEAEAQAERGNSIGDAASSLSRRVAVQAAFAALDWAPPPRMMSDEAETETQRDQLIALTTIEPTPESGVDSSFFDFWWATVQGCERSAGHPDGGGAPPPDWIDALIAAADADPASTLRDVVVALKDRLVNLTAMSAAEEAALAEVYGMSGLDEPAAAVSELEAAVRRHCGVLLASPQFVLDAVPPPPQTVTPRLVVEGATYRAACEDWAARISAATPGTTITCEAETLSVAR